MIARLPMFPLNSVLFPGMTIPLHVFEERYRALVRHLLSLDDPIDRVFGSVGIREGYEVGDHGGQSVYRTGVRVRMTEVEEHPDGTYSIVGVGLDRISIEHVDPTGDFPVADAQELPEATEQVSPEVLEQARATFTAYRVAMADLAGDPFAGTLPQDPELLSWALSACAPLPMSERQSLLEAEDAGDRLSLVTRLLRAELRAINVIPSLPATQVARTRWSPN
ncbi:LON peptidase substrate-binding domain-containing protein [Nocardioides sp. TRM66260-LWL]|uniref:LON peptidase substrate-binding domain-containing protein n=1 Tax=Nocardioides sp. TRM66260-LWL TaxID=2874478 RepID=UPI001CC6A434|nr:LON peptidase substrate-binding domain-containing protein [Nocardioides sp. TRM66260-LWL]MBZ5733365.1 LON peptidase substrate-binding domain-containing protein [Nocardioides sp. TRM66260-LWL]